ncbi:G-type lectin S-receptor-like serine/threonine-protein kinase RKS1 [Linum perenne]
MDASSFILLSILLLFHGKTASASNDTIYANRSIKDGSSFIISKDGTFAFGFFSPGTSSTYRYLGIWYHNKPGPTVVWVANRNTPINGTSGVLSNDGYGNLLLYSMHQEVPIWSTNVSSSRTLPCYAQLLDSGNLVLVVQGTIVWQSFDHPTDTLLPAMKIGKNLDTGLNMFLTSWRSRDDPGMGDFSYKLNPNGSPQFFLYHGTNLHWRSVPWPWNVYNHLYNASIVSNEHGIYYSFTPHDASIIFMVVIDSSGAVRVVMWDEAGGMWKESYAILHQKCNIYGHCGAYGKCDPSSAFLTECTCLPGYEPRSQSKVLLGYGTECVRKRLESSVCGHGEGFVRVGNVKIPDTSEAVWVDQVNCEQECRKNCSCSAYTSTNIVGRGTRCLTWHGEIMDTVHIPIPDLEIYIRVDALELAEYAVKSGEFDELRFKLSVLVPSISSVWIVCILFAYTLFKRWRKWKGMHIAAFGSNLCFYLAMIILSSCAARKARERRIRNLFHPSEDSSYMQDSMVTKEIKRSKMYPELPFFSLDMIRAATNNFSSDNKLGKGGFGLVYKGKFPSGEEVAVKRPPKNSRQGLEQFKSEVFLISKLQHRNLVKLHGCCIDDEEQMLIYEYLPYKSLDSLLFVDHDPSSEQPFLDWRKRLNIIVGIARGILYLHQDSRFRIIHRDLKTSNVLLDAELNPKISDFGMARVLEGDQVEGMTSQIGGTYGYMSPEYAYYGKFSVKSDVFSFGVMLLEIVTGKTIFSRFTHEEEDHAATLSLTGYVWELWKEKRVEDIVDPSLVRVVSSTSTQRCIHIGLSCIEEDPVDRPDMQTVVVMLNSETIPLPRLKRPAFVYAAKSRFEVIPKVCGAEECSINEMTYSDTLTR